MADRSLNVLVLSFYYEPDLSACSFRTTALVRELRSMAPSGSRIAVLTTAPNRYNTYNVQAASVEDADGVSVTRIPLPQHKSGLLDQSGAYIAYARAVLALTRGKKYDLVFATSSRLMTAVLGALVSRSLRAPLYLDIRDIFVDTVGDVFPKRRARLITPVLSLLERWAIGTAARVNVVSGGFDGYFGRRYPNTALSHFTNGIDEEFIQAAGDPPPHADAGDGRPLTIVYAGNIGEGQGLHTIVPGLALALGERARILIIGDGGRRTALEAAVDLSGATNVEILAPLQRRELLEVYRGADVLFLHLNDHAAFLKVLPSKVFEYAATGKPILAGVAGYAAEFLAAEVANAAVFRPCDVEGAVNALTQLTLRDSPRREFVERYARDVISRSLARDLLSTAAAG